MTSLANLVADLAREHKAGTVGITGADALGTAGPGDSLELFVCKCFSRLSMFGAELADATGRRVIAHHVYRTPWTSHLHHAVQWVNVEQLPRVEYPRGAVAHTRHGDLRGVLPLANIPHMHAIDGNPKPAPGCRLQIWKAPHGGFLL